MGPLEKLGGIPATAHSYLSVSELSMDGELSKLPPSQLYTTPAKNCLLRPCAAALELVP